MKAFEEMTRYMVATLLVWNISTVNAIACANHPKKADAATGQNASEMQAGGQGRYGGLSGVRVSGSGTFKSQMSDSKSFFKNIGDDDSGDDSWTSKIE